MKTKENPEELTVMIVDPDHHVYCDSCNEDFTNSPAVGGVLFNRKAYCPACAKSVINSAVKYNETDCLLFPDHDETFYNFVLRIR